MSWCKVHDILSHFHKTSISRQTFEKVSNIQFHENSFSCSWVVSCDRQADRRKTDRQTDGRTEIQTEKAKLMVAFLNFARAPTTVRKSQYCCRAKQSTRTPLPTLRQAGQVELSQFSSNIKFDYNYNYNLLFRINFQCTCTYLNHELNIRLLPTRSWHPTLWERQRTVDALASYYSGVQSENGQYDCDFRDFPHYNRKKNTR